LLVVLAGALYLPRRDIPRYLAPDEVFSSLTAESVARTGHDLNGRFLPLYFQLPDTFETRMWYQPIVIYAIAASVKALPFSQANVRLPMALAAILDVLLAYAVVRVLVKHEGVAVTAAGLLALTPAHFSDSRVAMDHHAFLPFILGWLLCLLLYVERRQRSWLFGAGLVLGVGLFTYIASYVLMPVFAAITLGVLFGRREPLRMYATLAAGFLLPVSVGAVYIAAHPAVITDTLFRYQRQPASAGTLGLAGSGISERVAKIAAVYASFWNPRVLFVSGPRAVWIVGQFMLPVAGLLLAAAMRIVRKPDTASLVLVAGLLVAPLPASFVGEPEVIRRAAGVMPFAILLAAIGLQYIGNAESEPRQRIAFALVWTTVIALALGYYNDIPRAQAAVRAATVPLALAGLAMLFGDVPFERISFPRALAVAAIALLVMHAAYVVSNQSMPVGIALLAVIGFAVLTTRAPAALITQPYTAVALLALVAGHFMFNYVDYAQIQRAGSIPASALILSARLIASFTATTVAILLARIARNNARGEPVAPRATFILAAVIALQLAYFAIDWFTDYRLRIVQVVAVMTAGIGVAMLVRRGGVRSYLGPITAAAVLTIAVAQFVPFYADYFTGFRARGNSGQVSARPAFDALLRRAGDTSSPTIYLGWPYALGELYWRFYLIEKHREDLLAHTVPDLDFKPERIQALPSGSLVLTTASPTMDAQIDAMANRGDVTKRDLIRDVDGTPAFWILETGSP